MSNPAAEYCFRRAQLAEIERDRLRALLTDIHGWMDGLGIGDPQGAFCPCTRAAEDAEELLPQVRAALGLPEAASEPEPEAAAAAPPLPSRP